MRLALIIAVAALGFRLAWAQSNPNQHGAFDTAPNVAVYQGYVPGPAFHTPASSSEACSAGQSAVDGTYIYWCASTNHWLRIAGTSF